MTPESWDIAKFLSAHAWRFLAVPVLLCLSAFFSGAETALFSLSAGRLHRLVQSGPAGGVLSSLMRSPQRLLNTLLLGNMLVNTTYTGIWAVLVIDLEACGAPAWVTGAASVMPLVLLILLGESSPKMAAMAAINRSALVVAWPLAIIQRALGPLLWLMEHLAVRPLTRLLAPRPALRPDITGDELASVLELSARRGMLDRSASSLLREIIELTDLRVADIMVPRVDMVTYDVDAPPQGLLDLFRRTRLRRVPLYEGDVEHIVGVVQAKRLFLGGSARLRDLADKVLFVPETANVERLLIQFRVRRAQMAIAVDEYGGTAGLVTLTDALAEIVGDIRDRRQARREPAVRRIADRQFLLDGDLPIHEWADTFRMELSSRRISTIGGFVTSLLGRIPRAGDEVTYRNLRFAVQSVRGRRIGKLLVTLPEAHT